MRPPLPRSISARRRPGAQVTNTPGAWNVSDLHTTDPAAAGEFYPSAFGRWVADQGWGTAIRVPGYGEHLEATTDPDIHNRQSSAPVGFEDVIGGIPGLSDGEQPHWHVTFTVADHDEAAATVERFGGAAVSTDENDWTHTALVRDPQGAALTLSQIAPKDWGRAELSVRPEDGSMKSVLLVVWTRRT